MWCFLVIFGDQQCRSLFTFIASKRAWTFFTFVFHKRSLFIPVWRNSCTCWTFLKHVLSVSLTLASWSVLYIYKNWSSGRYSLSLPLVSLAIGGSPRKANTGRPADLFTWWINQRGWRCWAEGVLKTQREPPTTPSQWQNFSALFTHAALKGFHFQR